MPELPDLQNFSRNLDKRLSGKVLKKVNVLNDKKLKATPAELKKALEEQTLKKVYREGKELHLKFSNDHVLGLHLMLKGSLDIFETKNEKKYPIIELIFDDDTGLAMMDYQGAATPTLDPEEKKSPDALSGGLDYKYLKERLAKTKTVIKTLLLDQKIVRGIGNAYADEILWDAGISPLSVSNKIPDEKIKALAKSIKSVLKNAIEQIYKNNPDIITGEDRGFLNIHNSKKKESPTGKAIHNTNVNSRITYYTDEQELYK